MTRRFLSAKLRDIVVTGAFIDYEGSITLDENYLEQTGILPFEEVHVLNVDTGTRFVTYAIKGKRGSGAVELNGPAAHLGKPGDRIMVLTYAYLTAEDIPHHKPRIVSILPK
ncbi:MAG TPA: aspartate 1-decarboxylase [Fibrobacteres bacterium]|jgi:aspartate 1-decarboxylase|nr:aspartate 1-decarboxylase [Fibrobacterota bacterium]